MMMSQFYERHDAIHETSDSPFELVAEDERKKFLCKHAGCGKVFRYKSEIMRHIATHSESRPFICQYDNCFKAFKRSDALENHVRSSHTKETPFACPFPDCGMKFTTHGSFRYHVLKHNKQHFDGESVISTKESLSSPSEPRKQFKHSSLLESMGSFSTEFQKKDPAFQKFGQDDLNSEFFAPPPRFASNVRWEMMNDETEDSAPINKNEEPQNDQLNAVVEENKILKQKLATSEKVIKGMQKQINDLLSSLFAYQSQRDPLPTTPVFQSFPVQNEAFLQVSSPETKSKSEDEPLLDMINYGEEISLPALAPMDSKLLRESSSISAFLSFGNGFDF